ncbi:acyl-CoA dehydrogenase family protein [Streptomyces cavernicola]|uniref:Acyl-CoA dehydrogenase family protein n=1 Tax=Streptomyces cavernicola TaxID=3043613 RepID=A0ABT6SIV1_9ACTN|nr:acyl-CoA dehydrogenase family protein [Streptomyces sp. B-S-A6]MDI3408110.1 acyl-CoA dehydrogenase family protein [Streptomyces sp. B-S-A6]
MRFLLDDEQREFARSLDKMLSAADPAATIRAWAAGDTGPGRALWARLAEAGVFALAVPDEHEGTGFLPVELAVSFRELGRHATPGPLVETVAAAALLGRLGGPLAADHLPGIASGKTAASLCLASPTSPYALDADAADAVFVVDGDTLRLAESTGPVQPSSDPARRLARPVGGAVLRQGEEMAAAAAHAAEVAALCTAAQALGVGRTLLAQTVAYVGGRTQFGVAIGSFQAVKHRLADALIALEFAEPLVHAAALALASGDAEGPASGPAVAAAKVAACEAAYTAGRSALQLHGALGYTEELDLSLWIRKARALRTAWGTPAECRARVLAG